MVNQKVQSVLTEIEDELRGLPEPPANALHVVTGVLAKYNQLLRRHMDGEQPNNLSKAWKEIKKVFHDTIVNAQRPSLIVTTRNAEVGKKQEVDSEIINLDDSDSGVESLYRAPTPSPTKKRKGAQGSAIAHRSHRSTPTSTPTKGRVVIDRK